MQIDSKGIDNMEHDRIVDWTRTPLPPPKKNNKKQKTKNKTKQKNKQTNIERQLHLFLITRYCDGEMI